MSESGGGVRDIQPKPQFVELNQRYCQLTGRRISHGIELKREGVLNQFARVQEIQERVDNKNVALPGDLMLAQGCADIALNHCHQRKVAVTNGMAERVEIPGLIGIHRELMETNKDDPRHEELVREAWYHDPVYGAKAAVDLLEKVTQLSKR